MDWPTLKLGDWLTEEQLALAQEINDSAPLHLIHQKLKEEVVLPNFIRLNEITGQENDPDYWAYAIEWVLDQSPQGEEA